MKIYDAHDFGALPLDVQGLLATSDSFFDLPGWYDLVARFSPRPDWLPKLAVDDGAMASVALCVNGRTGETTSLINPYTCEHAIAQKGNPRAVYALAREIALANPRTSRILLQGLEPHAPYFKAANDGLRGGGYLTQAYFCWANWHEDVKGKSFKDYLARRPSGLTNTWRRKSAALKKAAQISFEVFRSAELIEPFIENYDLAHRQSWKEVEPFPAFIPQLIRFAGSLGALRAGVLKIDNEVAASQFWIVWRGKALIFKLAHADKFQSHSPGTFLTMHMVEHVLEKDQPDQIDFGRGDDPYKKLWVSDRSERWGIEAVNPRTLRGFVLAGGIAAAKLRKLARSG